MAVRIRLARIGTHKRPYYRVVAADSAMPRDGRFLDLLGTYDPLKKPAEIKLDEEKVIAWLKKGAIPSETAGQVIKKSGILSKPKDTAIAS
jgi:small subunit ribosomal protein S16